MVAIQNLFMVKLYSIIFFCIVLSTTIKTFGQNKIDGTFVGLLRIDEWTDEKGKKRYYGDDFEPKSQWYHETTLEIKNDSVRADKIPVSFRNGKESYSSSDGGFYYYKGIIKNINGKDTIYLKLLYCDYCHQIALDDSDISKKKPVSIYTSDNGVVHKVYEADKYVNAPDKEYLHMRVELTIDGNLLIDNKYIFKRLLKK